VGLLINSAIVSSLFASTCTIFRYTLTVFGKVLEGMEFVDNIKRGDESNNGAVTDPDKIISFKSK
jgi:Peptidyl-prolyl cis-trans isomerase (rotamase) - cyclophilin family